MTAKEKQDGINRALKRWFFGWVAGGAGTVGMVILQDNPFPLGLIAVALLILGGMSWWIGVGQFLYYLCCPVDQTFQLVPARIEQMPVNDMADKLIALSELRRSGLITPEEFETQKKILLRS